MSYNKLNSSPRMELEGGQEAPFHPAGSLYSRWRTKLLKDAEPDEVEKALASQKGDYSNTKLLLSWYRRTRSSLQGTFLSDCFWLSTADGFAVSLQEHETISQGFDKFSREISSDDSPGLRVCAMTASNGGLQKAYSFPYEVYLTLLNRIDGASRVFHTLTARLVMKYWATEPFERLVLERLVAHPTPEPQQWRPLLPSSCKQNLYGKPWTAEELLQPSRPLDSSTLHGLFYLEWQWLGRVPNYRNDIDVYVWEPFKHKAPLDFVRLVALPTKGPDERGAVLVTSSQTVLQRLSEDPIRSGRTNAWTPSTDVQMFRLILTIYRIIREDTTKILVDATVKVEELNFRSRSNPSGWKAQLLSHLQECHLDLAQHCERNIKTLEMLFKCAPLPCTARDACLYTVLQELESCGADLECLVGHLHEKAAAITAVKKIVREQMDLVTHYRNTVIAVLVALYVPISFVSSFLGMNITDHSPSHYWRNLTTTAPVTAVLPRALDTLARSANLTNSTSSPSFTPVYIATNNPSSKTWSLNSFWASAFPLAFGTIIIPLVAGPAFRWIAQFAKRRQVWWRVIVMFLTTGAVLAIHLMLLSSQIAADHAWRAKSFKALDTADNAWYAALIMSWAEFGFIFILCIWHLWVAVRLRPAWMLAAAWLGITTTNLLCTVLQGLLFSTGYGDWTSEWPFVTYLTILQLLPWIALFLLWVFKPQLFFTIAEYRKRQRLRMSTKPRFKLA